MYLESIAEVSVERIRELRRVRGVSQAKLAVIAGMDPATLNRIEQGKANPNLRTLEKLADALGVGVADFFPKAQAQLRLDLAGEQLGSVETAEAQGSPRAIYNAEALGRALALQWWEALYKLEGTKENPVVYGAQLLAWTVAAGKTRASYEDAAQGEYASRPEFRETLRLMDEAHSAVKAEAKIFLNSLTSEVAQQFAKDFEEAFKSGSAELNVH